LVEKTVIQKQICRDRKSKSQETMRPIEWNISDGLTGYLQAVQVMEARVNAIAKGDASEAVWLVEHPPSIHCGNQRQPQRFD
jgi:lipoyl(octanoyl) transferase